MVEDPQEIITHSPMGTLQWAAVTLAIVLNALDGFDVMSISFAAPGIAQEWGIDRAALGIVLSMELFGMAAGSILIGQLCDRIGRRPTVLGCMAVVVCGMGAAVVADDILALASCRLVTGFGIGGILSAVTAVVAEYTNQKRRSLAVALMAGGFPIGGAIGGSFASALLQHHDWRAVFMLGAGVSFLCVPLVYIFFPETVAWLSQRRPPEALARINRTLTRMGHRTINALPPLAGQPARRGITRLFAAGLAPVTLLLTLAYFAHIMTIYFLFKWLPQIVVGMGFTPSAAGTVLVCANVGGGAGAITLSLLTQKYPVWRLVVPAMALTTILLAVFGRIAADLTVLAMTAAGTTFFANAATVGIYAIMSQAFPAALRAGGAGFVIGVGRGGSALSPVVAGFLFAAGVPLASVAMIIGLGSLIAAVSLMVLGYREHD